MKDVPHDYIQLEKPVQARYLKLENIHMAAGRFAISGFRVFGNAAVPLPDTVKQLIVLRGDSERRNAWLKWQPVDDATGYTIYAGVTADKMYTSIQVYGKNEYYFRAMDSDKPYYFQIEAFNEGGIGRRTTPQKAD
jgi:hypothetical protein